MTSAAPAAPRSQRQAELDAHPVTITGRRLYAAMNRSEQYFNTLRHDGDGIRACDVSVAIRLLKGEASLPAAPPDHPHHKTES
jgi:hypothetical protein